MKYLLVSDVHGDIAQCQLLVKKSQEVDMVLVAGDFGYFRKEIVEPIAVLSQIEKPTLIVHGNHENLEELETACCNWKSVHILNGNAIEINGISFFGIGGATPVTPFVSWSVDVSEKQAAKMLSACPKNSVLITHSPPYKCLDAISPKRHMGSKSIRTCIERNRPLFAVCGHIHEEWNKKDAVDTIPVFNAGPYGIIYEHIVKHPIQ